MLIDLCLSCSDDWEAAGLVKPAIAIDCVNEKTVCCHCGERKRCKVHEYIGRFKLRGGEPNG